MDLGKICCSHIVAAAIGLGALGAQAAPLPAGTSLTIQPGVSSTVNMPCSSGSCFAMEVAPNFYIWTNIAPGTDGGIVIGKSQIGQDTDRFRILAQ